MHGQGVWYRHLAGAAGSMHDQDSVRGRRTGLGAGPGVGSGDTELLERGVGAEPRWLRYRAPIHSGGWGITGHRDPRAGGAATGTAPTIPPRSRSQHRVAGSPAPSVTSPAGLLSVVPSRAPGFSQPIRAGCGEMWRLCSSPGAGTRQHPTPAPRPSGLRENGDAPWGPISRGNALPKGTRSSRGPASHRHSTTCALFSVSEALAKKKKKKKGIPKELRISKNRGFQLSTSPALALLRAPPALSILTVRQGRWNVGQGGHGT